MIESMEKIDGFNGTFRFLSNFWPCVVEYDGHAYPSVEHAYQAAKTLDSEAREKIQGAASASAAKKMGRKLSIRQDWEQIKLSVMEELVRKKFDCGNLRYKLIQTGDAELVEKNYWKDVFWGVCNGAGENNLGKILMKIRAEMA
jgi:hypothetical protein